MQLPCKPSKGSCLEYFQELFTILENYIIKVVFELAFQDVRVSAHLKQSFVSVCSVVAIPEQ